MRAALGRAQGSGADQERSETFEKRRGLTYLRRAEPGIRAQLRGTLSQRGKDRFRFRRVGHQSSREQADGEETTDGMEPAGSTSPPADTNSGARRRVGEYLPALVSGFPSSRAGQESGVTPRNLPLSGEGPLIDRPADVLKVWPRREANPTVGAGAIRSAPRSPCYEALPLTRWPIVAKDSEKLYV